MKLAIELIEVSDRVRDVQESAVEVIKKSMGDLGQQQPIIVRKASTRKFVLIDGQHRLAAAKRLGWAEIEAEVREFPGLSDLEAELEAKRLEIETTSARADQTIVHSILARDALLRVILKQRALTELKQAKAAVEEAANDVRQARRAASAACTQQQKIACKAELSRLRTIESNAIHKRQRAQARADAIFAAVENNVSIPENLTGIRAAIEEVAAIYAGPRDAGMVRRKNRREPGVAERFKVPPRFVVNGQKLVNGLGHAFLRKIAHTDLANTAQMNAALAIKSRHDEVTASGFERPNTPEGRVRKSFDARYVLVWKRGNQLLDDVLEKKRESLPDFWSEWKRMQAEEKSELRALAEADLRATAEGQWKEVRTELNSALKSLAGIDRVLSTEVADARLKTKWKDARRALQIVSDLQKWAEHPPR